MEKDLDIPQIKLKEDHIGAGLPSVLPQKVSTCELLPVFMLQRDPVERYLKEYSL